MGKKARTTLTIDEKVLRKAHKIGLNISQFCENALVEAIKRLEGSNAQTNGEAAFLGEASLKKKVLGSPGEIRTLVSGSRARHA